MYWLPETTRAKPRAACSPARVTMKGSRRKRVGDRALHRAEGDAGGEHGEQGRHQPQPAEIIIVAVTTLDRPSSARRPRGRCRR